MRITIKWKNRSTGADGIRIYRSNATMSETAMPAALATIDATSTSYNDDTAVFGAKYYYRTGVYKDSTEKISTEIIAYGLPRSGPGPQTLVDGDLELGIYGLVQPVDFINAASMIAFAGISGIATIGNEPPWFKFAYKGKTLFIPVAPLAYNTSWLQLYQAGLVHGRDDVGVGLPASISATPASQVLQNRTIKIGGETFRVRLMKGTAGVNAPTSIPTASNGVEAVGLEGSEWNDLIYPVITGFAGNQERRAKFVFGTTYTPLQVLTGTGTYGMTMCQECVANTNTYLLRGFYGSAALSYPGYGNLAAYNTVNYNLNLGSISYSSWRPVLEYVPS